MDWIHRLFEGAPQNSPKFSSSIHDSRCMILSLSGVPELCQSKACSRHTHFGKKCYALPLFNWVIVSWQARFEKSALSATNAHFELIQFHHSQSTFCRRIDSSWPPMPWFFLRQCESLCDPLKTKLRFVKPQHTNFFEFFLSKFVKNFLSYFPSLKQYLFEMDFWKISFKSQSTQGQSEEPLSWAGAKFHFLFNWTGFNIIFVFGKMGCSGA